MTLVFGSLKNLLKRGFSAAASSIKDSSELTLSAGRFIALFLSIFSFSFLALAGESNLDKWLNSLPPMSAEMRQKFDKAARSVYDKKCNCLVFWSTHSKRVKEAPLPLNDDDRYSIIEGIKRGIFIPLEQKRERSG